MNQYNNLTFSGIILYNIIPRRKEVRRMNIGLGICLLVLGILILGLLALEIDARMH